MLSETCKDSTYYAGVGLGQVQNRPAIVTVRKANWETGERNPYDYSRRLVTRLEVCQLDSFAAGAPLAEVAGRAAQISRNSTISGNSTFVADVSGAAASFFPLFFRQNIGTCRTIAVAITGADAETHRDNCYFVPMRNLISALMLTFNSGNLLIPSGLPGAEAVLDELYGMRATFHSGGQPQLAGEGNDDMMVALSLAIWRARKFNFHV